MFIPVSIDQRCAFIVMPFSGKPLVDPPTPMPYAPYNDAVPSGATKAGVAAGAGGRVWSWPRPAIPVKPLRTWRDAYGVAAARNKPHGIIGGKQQAGLVHAIRAGPFIARLDRALICGLDQSLFEHSIRWMGGDFDRPALACAERISR